MAWLHSGCAALSQMAEYLAVACCQAVAYVWQLHSKTAVFSVQRQYCTQHAVSITNIMPNTLQKSVKEKHET
jgi:hypothetical protein